MTFPCQQSVPDSTKNDITETAKSNLGEAKKRPPRNSNLATPTSFLLEINSVRPIFSSLKKSVPDKSASYAPRKTLTNARGYPYREARLFDHDNSPSRKWFISFYAWDIGKKKLIRKRVGKAELNKIRDLNERRKEALYHIRELNSTLQEGGYLETAKVKDEVKAFDFHGYKLLDALTYVNNHVREIEQRTKNTIRQYKYTKNVIDRFMKETDISKTLLLRQLTPDFTHRLTEYLRKEKKVSNKTYNGIVTIFHTAIEKLRALDPSLFPDRNPVKVNKLPEISRTHAAYSEDQIKQIVERITPLDPQLILFIRFIYFTLARPKEIRFIKVGHILMEHQRILMAGENAKTKIEKYVGIGPALSEAIEKSGILNYPHDYFVFSRNGTPGKVPLGVSYIYKRYKEHLKELGFKKLNDRYTLYSFKHSGAIQLYLQTKELELVQRQCRHTTIGQTNTYLQELGLFTNFKGLEKWKGI